MLAPCANMSLCSFLATLVTFGADVKVAEITTNMRGGTVGAISFPVPVFRASGGAYR